MEDHRIRVRLEDFMAAYLEHGIRRFLRKGDTCLPEYMASHPRGTDREELTGGWRKCLTVQSPLVTICTTRFNTLKL
jgi:hypothetical protein